MTTSQDINRLGEVAVNIDDDYRNRRSPFKEVFGVTTPITDQLESRRDKALFLTLTTSLNRQRDAERLYSKFERLWYDEHWIFDPETLIEDHTFDELAALFKEEGTRYGTKDAEVWYEISRTLYREFDSDPMNLFEQFDYNRQQISEYVVKASGDTRFFKHGRLFPALRGDKIRPVWLRLISRQVHPLGQMDGADVAVDTHIREITNKILGRTYTDSAADKQNIREFWRRVCEPHDIMPIEIDGPLWYIHRDWDTWGRRYLQRKLREKGLELGEVKSTDVSEPLIPERTRYETIDEWIDAVSTQTKTDKTILRAVVNALD